MNQYEINYTYIVLLFTGFYITPRPSSLSTSDFPLIKILPGQAQVNWVIVETLPSLSLPSKYTRTHQRLNFPVDRTFSEISSGFDSISKRSGSWGSSLSFARTFSSALRALINIKHWSVLV